MNRQNKKMNTLQQRKKLPHEVPSWVKQGARHFITINCAQKGANVPCHGTTADMLLESARFYESIERWYLWLILVMPDHMHLIAAFDLQHGIKNTVGDWKRYQTTHLNIEWQSDFFEHRLRDESEFEEKAG